MGCCWSKGGKKPVTGWVDGVESTTPRPQQNTELLNVPKKSATTSKPSLEASSSDFNLHEIPQEPAEQVDVFKGQAKIPGAVGHDVRETQGHEPRMPLASIFSSEEDIENAAIIQAVVRAHLARKHKQREHESFSILRVPLSRTQSSFDTSSLLIPHVPAGSVKTKAQVPRSTTKSGAPIASTSVAGLRGQLTFNSPSKTQPQQPPD